MKQWWTDKDVSIKLISVLVALVLWAFVIWSTDPVTTNTYTVGVSIGSQSQSILEEKGLVIVEGPGDVVFTLKGTISKFNNYSIDLFTSTINIPEDITEGEHFLRRVDLTNSTDITIDRRSPITSRIVVERLMEVAVPVEIDFEGHTDENSQMESYWLDPGVIKIYGPQSAVEAVSRARVEFNLENRRNSFETEVTYVLLDAEGNPADITMIRTIEPAALTLHVNMKGEKSVPVNVAIISAEYLNQDEIIHYVDPTNITIYGEPGELELINGIELDDISLKYVIENEDYELKRTIRIPDGVTVDPDTPEVATVYIEIPDYERKALEITQENLPASNLYTYPEQRFEVILFGNKEILSFISEENLIFTPNVQAEEMNPGETTVPLTVTVNVEGVAVISNNSVILDILDMGNAEGDGEGDGLNGGAP